MVYLVGRVRPGFLVAHCLHLFLVFQGVLADLVGLVFLVVLVVPVVVVHLELIVRARLEAHVVLVGLADPEVPVVLAVLVVLVLHLRHLHIFFIIFFLFKFLKYLEFN